MPFGACACTRESTPVHAEQACAVRRVIICWIRYQFKHFCCTHFVVDLFWLVPCCCLIGHGSLCRGGTWSTAVARTRVSWLLVRCTSFDAQHVQWGHVTFCSGPLFFYHECSTDWFSRTCGFWSHHSSHSDADASTFGFQT